MRTPITYYGGKQAMLKDILSRMYSNRECYIEPFFGGGAVFFGKEKERNEVINDHDDFVTNFYRVSKSNFDALNKMVQETLYAKGEYDKAITIFKEQKDYDDVSRAWAFWVLSRMSFGSIIGSGFSASIGYSWKRPNQLKVRKNEFFEVQDRLENVTIWNIDAVELIKRYDRDKYFFYIDPPYVGADQGGYKGYTQEMFNKLLEVLSNLKGKFLLSSYNNDKLAEYTRQLGWNKCDVQRSNRTTNGGNMVKCKKCIEVLTANYDMDAFNLF